jgi:uncharacterized protein (TIGR00251 family)
MIRNFPTLTAFSMSVINLGLFYMLTLIVMEKLIKRSKKGIILKVRVEPRSSRKGISGLIGNALKIRVNAPPVGGAANEELVEILSKEFGIKKTAIKIIKGQFSRDKVVEIEGMEGMDQLSRIAKI